MTIPVIFFDKADAERTYRRHQALVQAETTDPSLAMDPMFVGMRKAAYAAFLKAFGRGE